MNDVERLQRWRDTGKLIVGDSPGWQTRLSKVIGLSPAYVSHINTGQRPLTREAEEKMLWGLKAAIETRQSQIGWMKQRLQELERDLEPEPDDDQAPDMM
ncbi:MAG TPA: hypothetical protein DIT93_14545 [Pelagibacterium sp.]|uniref:hypothetical protein n=1 Tax=uncultured Pelagibacterium sp. TaxID=1159875 RepID=UPI000ED6B879|nr:hypothetical protein [Pelagibacterium sp.]|tara:strand:+ start:2763 stop:3062 length:300 start_codon:yes stop_codon:yes gene_type:complete